MHVPIIIEDQYYIEVVREIREALSAGGVETRVYPAPTVLRVSLKYSKDADEMEDEIR